MIIKMRKCHLNIKIASEIRILYATQTDNNQKWSYTGSTTTSSSSTN